MHGKVVGMEFGGGALRAEGVENGGVAARACDDHDGDGLRERLGEGGSLEDRGPVKLEAGMAVDRIEAESGHVAMHGRAVPAARQVDGALHQLLLALSDERRVCRFGLQPDQVGRLEYLPVAQLRDPRATFAVAQENALHAAHDADERAVRGQLCWRTHCVAH